LARGLDYYTGIIYEAIVEASAPPGFKPNPPVPPPSASTAPPPKAKPSLKPQADEDGEPEVDESTVGVGSIAAGGRYDNLVQLFTAAAAGDAKKKAPGLPCVGVSIGLDRVFALTWPKWVERGGRSKETVAYVMAAGDGLLEERVALVRELREAGIKVRSRFSTRAFRVY
jgi:histidyl-tRNA synthetase